MDGRTVGSIGPGMLVFVGVGEGDTAEQADRLAGKLARLRIFVDDEGRMNRSVPDIGGEVLVVSQFTLLADTSRGNRPSSSAPPRPTWPSRWSSGSPRAARAGLRVAMGEFGAHMEVDLVNDGPVTIVLELGRASPAVVAAAARVACRACSGWLRRSLAGLFAVLAAGCVFGRSVIGASGPGSGWRGVCRSADRASAHLAHHRLADLDDQVPAAAIAAPDTSGASSARSAPWPRHPSAGSAARGSREPGPRRPGTVPRRPVVGRPRNTTPDGAAAPAVRSALAARWSSSARDRGLVRQPWADHRRCRVSTKSRPLRCRRKSSLAWPGAEPHRDAPPQMHPHGASRASAQRRSRIPRSSSTAHGPCTASPTSRPVCAHRHTRVSHDTVPTPRRVQDGPPRKEGQSLDAPRRHAAPKCQMADARSANWHTPPGPRSRALQRAMHDVEPDQALGRVVERLRARSSAPRSRASARGRRRGGCSRPRR